jgi:hypothetical protein
MSLRNIHIAIMKKSWGFIPKILSGEKTIESRWYRKRITPWNKIFPGDTVYFKNSGEPVVARATVAKVKQFENLTPHRVESILARYSRKSLGLYGKPPPAILDYVKGKKYCLLIFLKDARPVESFEVDKTGFGAQAAWLTVDKPDDVKIAKPLIYAFAFSKRNISAATLWGLKHINHRYQVWPNNLDRYLDLLLHDQPAYVLGLGLYSGRDREKIRIETKCTNKLSRGYSEGNKLIEVPLNPFLVPSGGSKYGQRMGNSLCNLTSWKIMKLVNSGRLRSRYTFLHLPKTMKTPRVVAEVDKMLADFKRSKARPLPRKQR